MDIKPSTLIALCAALFGGIVAINLIAQQRENDNLRTRLSTLNLGDLVPRLKREEMMEQPEVDLDSILPFENTKEDE